MNRDNLSQRGSPANPLNSAISGIEHDPLLRSFRGLDGKILLFGGSFDPVHIGHIEMARAAATQIGASAVVFIPAHQNPLKANAPVASNSERLEILTAALRREPGFFVSPIELERGTTSYTVDTLRSVRGELPQTATLHLLLGSDCLPALNKWREHEQIFALATVIAAARDNFNRSMIGDLASTLSKQEVKALESNFLQFDNPWSSTKIRAALQRGELASIAGAIPQEALSYILSKRLYQK